MAHSPQKLSQAEVQAETAKFLIELHTPGTQQESDWVPELTGLLEELQTLARQDVPDQTQVAELSFRIRAFVRRPHMKGVGYIQEWIDSLVDDVDA